MKIVRYLSSDGPRWGWVHDDRIMPLGRGQGDHSPHQLEWLVGRAHPQRAAGVANDAGLPLAAATLLAPIEPTATVYCVGLNYHAHATEAGRDLPPHPSLFVRRHASLVGAGQSLHSPANSEQLDFEGELALVIGKGGRHIAAPEALAHVGAYTCFNDGSVRDFQRHSVTAGKNFEASGACGPWLVSADEIADPADLHLATRVNGVEMQSASTGQLIYPIATLISYVSSFAQLRPGDVIATGTPEGVGAARKPPRWLRPGDRVEVEISGIGTLENRVAVVADPTDIARN
jgi:2-keto-4-pentenoate hydratase/2-oxohepta-3-ene-1,7-dioic acid hydratase in catechol pathway